MAIILRYSFAVIRLARQWSSICAIREVIKSDRDRCEEHINDLLSLLEFPFRSYSLPIVRDIIRFRTIDIDSGKLGFRVNFEKRKRGTRRKIINGEIRSAIQGAVYIFSLRRNLLQITCNSQTRIFFLTSDQSLFYVASFGARYKGSTKFGANYYFSRCVSIFIFQNFMLYFIIRAT